MERQVDGEFSQFVKDQQSALLRTAYLLTGDHAAAEDLLQTALMKTYARWSSVTAPAAFTRRVLVTTYTSWLRRRSFTERPVADPPDVPSTWTDEPDDRKEELMTALATLPPRMRAAVVLRFYEDLTEADTAAVMGCSVGTVKTQTHRGLARLRVTFPDFEGQDEVSGR